MSVPMPKGPVIVSLPEPTALQGPKFPDRGHDNGKVLRTADNLQALMKHCSYSGRYNLMTAESEVICNDQQRLDMSAAQQRSMLIDACQRFGLPDQAIDDHLTAICQNHSYHPVREWLDAGGVWDGQDRLTGVIQTLRARDNQYAQQVMKPWLVGCVAALYEKRFSSKLVPVLQGGQSFMKSAWITRVCSVMTGAVGDGSLNPDKPDDVRRVCSHWVNELAELESTTRHEAGGLKAFITRNADKFRVPYARGFTIKPRQTSFIGTVNGSEFLKDQTGNTRFAVIEMAEPATIEFLNCYLGWEWKAGRITLVEPEQLRQFWLQVKTLYDAGESWFLDEATSKQAATANENHTDKGAYYAAIVERHIGRPAHTTAWLTPSAVCKLHGERAGLTSQYGKALKRLAEEGLIECRSLRGGSREYLIGVKFTELASLNKP
ncbi:ATPase [Aeromonas hydrophila]|uniref:VapE domain-containing protein n=1 Tax=Aeromonas hydrophila TaxID=644 RepID=UPI0022528410|nr:VapE domain-containing protein [Aeromonas hydrophila]MCX4041388.1 ATPase [Aeromonas hydrophila]